MNAKERRSEIIKKLYQSTEPIPAKAFAAEFGVSRQVIVQDVAVIRVSIPAILSTYKGYVIQQQAGYSREFKVRHADKDVAQELNLIVDCGGTVKNVSINHRVYGRISADLNISSRQDVHDFLSLLGNSSSTLLGNTTSGYHYHLVEADSERKLDIIKRELEEAGFLAPLLPWEEEQ